MYVSYKKGYSTHTAMLIKAIENSSGNVLEFGAGIFSTPLLHWLCKDLGKKLVTLESNDEYYQFAHQFQSRDHRIIKVNDWDKLPISGTWGVVFIDHDDPPQRRGRDAAKFKDIAEYVVMHDTEVDNFYGYEETWKHFKYRYDWKECRPWTSVLSNVHDLSWLKNK